MLDYRPNLHDDDDDDDHDDDVDDNLIILQKSKNIKHARMMLSECTYIHIYS